ncbi:MAG: 50S ribosomal protein L3 [bacterium]|nr:50S ribosomal protein L3 [bacterium]
MKFILGKKIEMSSVWKEDGKITPVTAIAAGPCFVVATKTKEKDGYAAVQIGSSSGDTNIKKNKPEGGHLKGLPALRFLKEFRVEAVDAWKRGDELKVDQFKPGEKVKVVGQGKGKGFQGVVKRHRFAGHPSTHGHKDQERMPGAISAGGLQHVRKGTRMAGRMGGERVTVHNLEVVKIDAEKNILYLKGAVPGGRNSLLMISGA